MNLDEFTALAHKLVDEVPSRLVRDLNGGFLVMPETKRDGEFLVMGEYIEEGYLGSFIVFYYGSFAALFADEEEAVWIDELRETIWHELRHHLESLAGVDDLAREELEELLRYLEDEREGARGGTQPEMEK